MLQFSHCWMYGLLFGLDLICVWAFILTGPSPEAQLLNHRLWIPATCPLHLDYAPQPLDQGFVFLRVISE